MIRNIPQITIHIISRLFLSFLFLAHSATYRDFVGRRHQSFFARCQTAGTAAFYCSRAPDQSSRRPVLP
jgi:hypothetical protein